MTVHCPFCACRKPTRLFSREGEQTSSGLGGRRGRVRQGQECVQLLGTYQARGLGGHRGGGHESGGSASDGAPGALSRRRRQFCHGCHALSHHGLLKQPTWALRVAGTCSAPHRHPPPGGGPCSHHDGANFIGLIARLNTSHWLRWHPHVLVTLWAS